MNTCPNCPAFLHHPFYLYSIRRFEETSLSKTQIKKYRKPLPPPKTNTTFKNASQPILALILSFCLPSMGYVPKSLPNSLQ